MNYEYNEMKALSGINLPDSGATSQTVLRVLREPEMKRTNAVTGIIPA